MENKEVTQDVALITNRHRNKAIKLLGRIYKTKMNPPNDYPEIGAVEVNNAVNTVTNLLAEIEHLETKKSVKGLTLSVLDKGYVRLVDFMGNDVDIVEAARVSYKSPSKGEIQDKKLLQHLWKHRHTSPFEQVCIKFNIKLPLFVQGQMVRHRTQKLNQVSFRYTEAVDEFYIPKNWRKQDTRNKQGSIESADFNPEFYDLVSKNDLGTASELFEGHCMLAYNFYKTLLEKGVAREMARMILPQNIYTEIYTTWDLNNLTKFFSLRLEDDSQLEIREFARAMYDITKQIFPWTIAAFDRFKFKLIDMEEELRQDIENGK